MSADSAVPAAPDVEITRGDGSPAGREAPRVARRVPPARGQLISYIAPAAPATRRPAEGDEPFMRPEVGFTPKWYREHLGIDFGARFHTDPAYRRECVRQMRAELRRRFPGTRIGGIHRPDTPLDLLTGIYGACTVAAIYGVPIRYAEDLDNWPNCEHRFLTAEQVDRLEPPDLDRNPHFTQLMEQVEWIAAHEGRVEGFVNWQGVLNNAYRLRGEDLFIDLLTEPARCRHLFTCVSDTMLAALGRLHARQRASGVQLDFITVSNCLVNMVSPDTFRELFLPFDRKLAEACGCLGVHHCAWNATPYLADNATLPGVGYIDMGLESDLVLAKSLFPAARRALMYTPMDVANKSLAEIESDFRRIAAEYAPCDIVLADIEAGTADARVRDVIALCERLAASPTGINRGASVEAGTVGASSQA
ncbi:MAG: hypothetical protein FJ399_18180 [Verrucomicrobia bacterium]|nr:hypothetical protein [Verrucomicrobiota bacterium]